MKKELEAQQKLERINMDKQLHLSASSIGRSKGGKKDGIRIRKR